jgi:hypothetical protein
VGGPGQRRPDQGAHDQAGDGETSHGLSVGVKAARIEWDLSLGR